MLALIDAATAHLQQAEVEGATEKLAPVLALPGEQRLETFAQRLAEMRDVLRRCRHATSRSSIELQQKVEEFRAGALGPHLSRRPSAIDRTAAGRTTRAAGRPTTRSR